MIYGVRERGTSNRFIKIGWSNDPTARPKRSQTFNWRKLDLVFVLPGDRALESKIHEKFSSQRVGRGGREWFKVTPDLQDFLCDNLKQALTAEPECLHKQFGDSPSRIASVELGTSEPRPAPPVRSLGQIQPHAISVALPPKNRYARLRKA